jgi:hypothetical protein
MAVTPAALGVSVPYQSASQEIVDAVLWQVYYRTFGMVGIHIGVTDTYNAAQWLAANGRGGQVRWLVPNRVFLWSGMAVTPGISGSGTMSALFGGTGLQFDTAIARVGFWLPRVWARVLAAT